MAYDIIEVELIFDDLNSRIDKSISSFNYELAHMRVGRANAHLLDGITVDFYGVPTPINQMANVTIPEARVLAISVWDASKIKDVEKAIISANIGITPNNDGKIIRLIFPEPTEERRRALVKDVKNLCEKTKVAIRNIRRDAIDELKKLKKDSTISEDLQKTYEADVEKIVNAKIADTDKISSTKEIEILKV